MATAVGTMTDRSQTRPSSSPTSTKARATDGSRQDARPSAKLRKAHPLLDGFPLAVMTLATFLVLFTVMMARLKAGADPSLRPSTSVSLIAGSPGAGRVTARASGGSRAGTTATPVARSAESAVTSGAIVTRTSGAPDMAAAGDD
jgi:hypothetical protein